MDELKSNYWKFKQESKKIRGYSQQSTKIFIKKPHKSKIFLGLISEFYNQLDHNTKYVDVCRVREWKGLNAWHWKKWEPKIWWKLHPNNTFQQKMHLASWQLKWCKMKLHLGSIPSLAEVVVCVAITKKSSLLKPRCGGFIKLPLLYLYMMVEK